MLAAERLHGDDTTVPILAKGKTDTGRIWTYVRDDRPFGGTSPPAALYYASRDRRQEYPERHLKNFAGILQADAYGGYNPLFKVNRDPSPLTQALCWAHAPRKFFVLADIATSARRGKQTAPISPMALEAVNQIAVMCQGDSKVYLFNASTYAYVGVWNGGQVITNGSALGYDAEANCLITNDPTTPSAVWRDFATGSTVKTVTIPSDTNNDQFRYSEARKAFVLAVGANGIPGLVREYRGVCRPLIIRTSPTR